MMLVVKSNWCLFVVCLYLICVSCDVSVPVDGEYLSIQNYEGKLENGMVGIGHRVNGETVYKIVFELPVDDVTWDSSGNIQQLLLTGKVPAHNANWEVSCNPISKEIKSIRINKNLYDPNNGVWFYLAQRHGKTIIEQRRSGR